MKLITRWNALPGKMLDDILAKSCEQCERLWTGNDYARLMRWCVGRDAAGHEIWQRRVVCIGCHAKLGNPMKAADHPRWQAYPVYDAAYERLTEAVASGEISTEPLGVLPEEAAEIALAGKPVGLDELIAAILRGEWPLEHAREQFAARGVTLGFCDVDTDVVELAHRLGPGSYAALMFEEGARLLRFDHDQIKVLKPHRAGTQLDLSDVSTITLRRVETTSL